MIHEGYGNRITELDVGGVTLVEVTKSGWPICLDADWSVMIGGSKNTVRLLVWSLTASILPFAASALGSEGVGFPLFCRHEAKSACPSTAVVVAPVAAGMLSNLKTR